MGARRGDRNCLKSLSPDSPSRHNSHTAGSPGSPLVNILDPPVLWPTLCPVKKKRYQLSNSCMSANHKYCPISLGEWYRCQHSRGYVPLSANHHLSSLKQI